MIESPDLLTAAAAAWPAQDVLFYDGGCRWCTRLSHSAEAALLTRGIRIAPFPADFDLEEIKLVRQSGRLSGGMDAVLEIMSAWPILRPAAWIGRRRWIHALLGRLYRKIAVSRHCLKSQCAVGAAPPISVRIIDAFIRCAAAVIQRIYPPREAR